MTITIDDVVHILGISVGGEFVTGYDDLKKKTKWSEIYKLVKETLGLKKNDATKVLGADKKISLKWLREKFSGSKENGRQASKKYCARAYLLYAIGSVLCGDKSGSKVPVFFLFCLQKLDEVNKYSWGTACLSWLYHNLGLGSRVDVHQIAGCMTLLQVWIYEHFPILKRHDRTTRFMEGMPRAASYITSVTNESLNNLSFDLKNVREMIDDLREYNVVWDPYRDLREFYPFQKRALYNGPLICFDVAEFYYPHRVLRQFGYMQVVPPLIFSLDRRRTKSSGKSFKAAYLNIGGYNWENWRNHLIDSKYLKHPVVNTWDCDPKYNEWFKRISHPYVANPVTRGMTSSFIPSPPESVPTTENSKFRKLYLRLKRRVHVLGNLLKGCGEPRAGISMSLERRERAIEMVDRIHEEEPLEIFEEHKSDDNRSKSTQKKKKSKKS